MELRTFENTSWKKGDKIKHENGNVYEVDQVCFSTGTFRVNNEGMYSFVSYRKIIEKLSMENGFADEETFSEISNLRRKCACLQDRLEKKTKIQEKIGDLKGKMDKNENHLKEIVGTLTKVYNSHNWIKEQLDYIGIENIKDEGERT